MNSELEQNAKCHGREAGVDAVNILEAAVAHPMGGHVVLVPEAGSERCKRTIRGIDRCCVVKQDQRFAVFPSKILLKNMTFMKLSQTGGDKKGI